MVSIRVILPPRFSKEELYAAADSWGCNCGPSSLAAMAQISLDEARLAINSFDAKRYTNPTMMNDALRSLEIEFKKIGPVWPDWGLVRIQWEGPWTEPNVPHVARYRQTHWIGAALKDDGSRGIFDCNAMANGTGWSSFQDWSTVIVPHILRDNKRAYGSWHVTHCLSFPARSAA